MEIIAFLLAERVERNERGNMSVHDMFNALYASELPAKAGAMALLLRTVYQAHEATGTPVNIAIRMVSANGDILFHSQCDVTLPAPQFGYTWAQWDQGFLMDGLPLKQAGEYEFEVYIQGTRRSTLPLIVTTASPATWQTSPVDGGAL